MSVFNVCYYMCPMEPVWFYFCIRYVFNMIIYASPPPSLCWCCKLVALSSECSRMNKPCIPKCFPWYDAKKMITTIVVDCYSLSEMLTEKILFILWFTLFLSEDGGYSTHLWTLKLFPDTLMLLWNTWGNLTLYVFLLWSVQGVSVFMCSSLV